jgi:hypothetical protein
VVAFGKPEKGAFAGRFPGFVEVTRQLLAALRQACRTSITHTILVFGATGLSLQS